MKLEQKLEHVFICSPYSGDTTTNTRKAMKYCRFAVENDKLPIAPHLYFPRFLHEDNPIERSIGIVFGLDLMPTCKQMWVFGSRISIGMQTEIEYAKKSDILIRKISDKDVDEFLESVGKGDLL